MQNRIFGVRTGRDFGVAGLALAVFCGLCVFSPPAAHAAGGDVSVSAPPTTRAPQIFAASDNMLLRLVEDEETDTWHYVRSVDGGQTWLPATMMERYPDNGYASDGLFTYQDENDRVWRLDLATNASHTLGELSRSATALNHSAALFWDENDDGARVGMTVADLTSGQQHTLPYKQRKLRGMDDSEVVLGSGLSAFVATAAWSKGKLVDGWLDRLPLDGGQPVGVKVAGLATVGARGDQAIYVTATKSGASLCFRTATKTGSWGAASCKLFKKGDQRAIDAHVWVGDDWVTINLFNEVQSEQFVVRGSTSPGTPMRVAKPAGSYMSLYGVGDSTDPIADLATSSGGRTSYYRADGTLDLIADYEESRNFFDDVALTPGGVLYTDHRPSNDMPGARVWSRSIAQGTAGTETMLAPRASQSGLSASGDRTIIRGREGVTLLDRGRLVRQLPVTTDVRKLSGGYYLAERGDQAEMRTITGARVLTSPVIDIFGSLALKRPKKNVYQVIDVAGTSKALSIAWPADASRNYDSAQIWGDWIATPSNTDGLVAFNYRSPGQVLRLEKSVDNFRLGDGFVLFTSPEDDDQYSLNAWDLVNGGSVRQISGSTEGDFQTDGVGRLVVKSDQQLLIRELEEGGDTQPRLLGLAAPTSLNNLPSAATWNLEVDATKALQAGTLTIRNQTGSAVRTIDVKAAPNGSIRDLSWNGRNDTGDPVTPGSYIWELTVEAADGTGKLVRVNGTSGLKTGDGIGGTIKVISKTLGTVSGTTPKISDTTPVVGQELSAKPGTWKPAVGVELSYQWFRGSKAVNGATKATYQVAADDLGQRLTVRLTGTADAWKTTTKTSKATSKVAKGTLAPKPAVSLDQISPKIGDAVSGTVGSWPADTTQSLQWYRVAKGKSTAIAGAVGMTYIVQATDAGFSLRLSAIGRKLGYNDATVWSVTSTVVPKA